MSPSIIPTRLPRCARRDRQVHRHGRLADAALSRTNGDHVLHARDAAAVAVGDGRGAHGGRHLDLRRPSRREGATTSGMRLIPHLVLHRAGRRGQLDGERDAGAIDHEVLDEAERDDVLAAGRGREQQSAPGGPRWVDGSGHRYRRLRVVLDHSSLPAPRPRLEEWSDESGRFGPGLDWTLARVPVDCAATFGPALPKEIARNDRTRPRPAPIKQPEHHDRARPTSGSWRSCRCWWKKRTKKSSGTPSTASC